MTARVHPTLILKMDMDERMVEDDTLAEIKRSYSYIAPATVVSHEPADSDSNRAENNLRLMIKVHRPYWDKNDADAAGLWDAVMPKWLHNMFYKVSSTITASNKVHAEKGGRGIEYAWLELEFRGNALVSIKTDPADSSIPECSLSVVEKARDLLCDGALGEGIACVRVPSRGSYESQLAAAQEEAAKKAEEEAVAAEAAEEADAAEVADGEEAVEAEAVQGEAASDDEASEAAEGAEGDAEGDGEAAEEEEPKFAPEKLPDFDVDYGIWGVEYEDGSVREYDSEKGAFVE